MINNLNIQNELVVKVVKAATVQCPRNPAEITINEAIAYPNGVFQLNGSLK